MTRALTILFIGKLTIKKFSRKLQTCSKTLTGTVITARETFYEFKRQIKYKCEMQGIEFVEVSRFYASSKVVRVADTIKLN